MKAFTIKIKEGCYWLGGFYGKNNYNDIAHAKVYHLKSQAEKQCKLINETYNYNAQVVEITIEEVDKNLTPTNYDNLSIEDKLKYRENQVRIARDRDIEYNNNITELEFTIKRLEEELAEKDNEINKIKWALVCETQSKGNLEQQLAIIKRALLKASKEAFGNKISFVSSNYSKKITNSEEYAEYLIFETESEVRNGN